VALHVGNATMNSFRIVVDVHLDINNIKPLSFAMKKQEWVPFALFCAENNSYCNQQCKYIQVFKKVPEIFSRFNQT
jgi:hypothetical protein